MHLAAHWVYKLHLGLLWVFLLLSFPLSLSVSLLPWAQLFSLLAFRLASQRALPPLSFLLRQQDFLTLKLLVVPQVLLQRALLLPELFLQQQELLPVLSACFLRAALLVCPYCLLEFLAVFRQILQCPFRNSIQYHIQAAEDQAPATQQ